MRSLQSNSIQENCSATKTNLPFNYLQQRFLNGIQHEIRTPFVGMLGLTQYLRDSEKNPKRRAILETLLNSNNRLLDFLNQLIFYAEASRKPKIQPTLVSDEVELRGLLYNFRTLLKPTLDKKRIQFHYAVSDNVPPLLYGDVYRVQLIIFYLLNTLVARMEKGFLSVFCENIGDNTIIIKLSIKIIGLDFDLTQKKHFFEPFSDEATLLENQPKIKGSALGLSIVKGYLEQLGGHITFKKQTLKKIQSDLKKHVFLKDQKLLKNSQWNDQLCWECCCEFPLKK